MAKPSAAAAGVLLERSKWPPRSTFGASKKASVWLSAASLKPAAKAPNANCSLSHLQLKGVILSGDAAYCQHNLASYLNAQEGDYVLNLKGNQPDAKAEIHPLLETLAASRPPDLEQTEKGHGRLEIRRCWVTGDVAGLACRGQWSGLTSLALCERETLDLITGKVTIGRRYFVTSLKPEASLISRCVRNHWRKFPM